MGEQVAGEVLDLPHYDTSGDFQFDVERSQSIFEYWTKVLSTLDGRPLMVGRTDDEGIPRPVVSLTKSAKPGVDYQVTRFSKYGAPIGHGEVVGALTAPENIQAVIDRMPENNSYSDLKIFIGDGGKTMANFKKRTKEEIEADVDHYRNEIIDAARDYTKSPEDVHKLMDFMSQFPSFSYNNQLLILKQFPNATAVAGYAVYKKLGAHPLKGTHGIRIFEPTVGKAIELENKQVIPYWKATDEQKAQAKAGKLKVMNGVTGFHLGVRFEVSQTSLKPEQYPKLFPNRPVDFKVSDPEMVATLNQQLDAYSHSRGVEITESPDTYRQSGEGVFLKCVNGVQRISIQSTLPEQQKVAVRIHEIAHSLLHADKEVPTEVAELQAEATSYIVSKHYGIDTYDSAADYISSWTNHLNTLEGEDRDAQLKVLSGVSLAAKEIIGNVDEKLSHELELQKEPEREEEIDKSSPDLIPEKNEDEIER